MSTIYKERCQLLNFSSIKETWELYINLRNEQVQQ